MLILIILVILLIGGGGSYYGNQQWGPQGGLGIGLGGIFVILLILWILGYLPNSRG